MKQLAAVIAAFLVHAALATPASAQDAEPAPAAAPVSQIAWESDTAKAILTPTILVLGAGLAATSTWVLASDGSCIESEGALCVERQEFDDWFLGWNVAQLVIGVAAMGLGIWAATLPVSEEAPQGAVRVTPQLAVSPHGALAGVTIELF